jgi:hypothetical protein
MNNNDPYRWRDMEVWLFRIIYFIVIVVVIKACS